MPDARVPGPCHWLLLVSYSGATVFLERAGVFRSRTRKKKKEEGLKEKGGEAEFLTGDCVESSVPRIRKKQKPAFCRGVCGERHYH